MPHPCNAESDPPADSEQIIACVNRVLTHIEHLKPQLGRFHQFVRLDGLKQELQVLANLFQADASQTAVRNSSKADRHPPYSATAHLTRSPRAIGDAAQETITQVMRMQTIERRPIIYMTTRECGGDVAKIAKHCKQTKTSASEAAVPNSNDMPQTALSPHGLRQSIFTATKLLCLLEHMMKLILATQTDPKQVTDAAVRSGAESMPTVTSSTSLLSHMCQVRRLMNRISEAVERINNRRHLDRVLIHLRRRSTAKSLIYLIDQERHKKSRWRL